MKNKTPSKTAFRFTVLFFLFLQPLFAVESSKIIYVIPIRDEIENSMVYQVRRGVKEAINLKASALILHMNTPGGEGEAMKEIMETIAKFQPGDQTYTLVDHDAFSAGAFISAATRHIYMTPGSKIGAASPITMGQGGVEELPPKFVSAFAGIIRAAAEQNGHDPLVFEAMVNKQKGLTIDGKELVAKGDILTLTTSEAIQLVGKPPHPLLAEGSVSDLKTLELKIGGANAQIVEFQPTGYEKVGRLISVISPFLLTAGFILGYLEFKTPGMFIFAAGAALCFVIYFFGHYISGLNGYGPIVVFAAGIALVLLEFAMPGLFVPALFGIIFIFGAILFSMIDWYPNDSSIPTLTQLDTPLRTLFVSMLLAGIIIGLLARFLPKKVLYKNLQEATEPGPQISRQLAVGDRGVAVTPLRPSGTARFGEDLFDVTSDGLIIDPETEVVVHRIDGVRIIVRSMTQ